MPSSSIPAVRALARVSRILERASGDLSLADYRVLSAIAEGEGRASRLAARLTLGKPAISSSVDSLVRRGLLLKSHVDGDQRATALSLTAEGEAVLGAAEAHMLLRLEAVCAKTADPAATMAAIASLGPAIEAVVAEREVTA